MGIALLSRKTKEINKVVSLPIEAIAKNPNQPRKFFDERNLEELSDSIAMNGLLQPVSVRRLESGKYELIAGERRLLAYKRLGREYIPAIIEDISEKQSAVFALIENLQRKELGYLEEAYGIANILRTTNLTQQELSVQLGKAQSTVANKLRLLKLPIPVQERILDMDLTERHARTLLQLTNIDLLMRVLDQIEANSLNVCQTEELVASMLRNEEKSKAGKNRIFIIKDVRLFINTINKAVSLMNKAGIPAETKKEETEEYLEYTIRMPKTSVYKQR